LSRPRSSGPQGVTRLLQDGVRLLAGSMAQRALWLVIGAGLLANVIFLSDQWDRGRGAASTIGNSAGAEALMLAAGLLSFIPVLAMTGIVVLGARREGATHVRLRRSLSQCETLFREMHHRTKNNLQLVSSLIALQWRNDADPSNRERARVTLGRISLVAEAHQQLYLAGRQTRVNCSEYLKTICDSLALDTGRVAISLDCPTVFLPLAQAVPLGLVVNELVTNAIKHGARPGEASRVAVVCQQPQPGALQIVVSDDGPGMPAGQIGNGLGLILVESLVGQLHGEWRVDSGDGTRVELTVAIEPVDDEYESTTTEADRAATS